ncbi:esterase [Flavobacterium franklandianum]|uniref:Esterase n=1 Tax=Flavobacterium franklandianum TaxID=2594430 RepID=A0A553CNY4_9FLAO|nr:esterase [Flavobacterium franklandianum]TRX22288.1 esterase [Flavobacterium franklandianum]
MKRSINRWLFAVLCILQFTAFAQPRGPFTNSPQVHEDKTVTFEYLAPNAQKVLLSGQFLTGGPVEMKKGEQGIWRTTVGPIAPDMYPYNFEVDGVGVMDPGNVNYFPNERFKGSILLVPGNQPRMYEMRNVPHGSVNYEYYPSLENSTGYLVVYTPPGYDASPDKSFPVFYLISGTTDTEETFYKVGNVNWILDNLIAEGLAKPMIVVMPYGNVAARIAEQNGKPKPEDPARESEASNARMKQLENDLIKNIIPYIESNYRAIKKRESRAIGGFSRGGGQTLRAAYGNLDTFGSICCYSASASPKDMDNDFSYIGKNPEQTNAQLKLNWVSVGNSDFMYPSTVEYMNYLNAHNIKYQGLITSGGHTWMNVKKFMIESLQLLFK